MTKKMRFEVFKRDSFTCQYCGRKVPDVTLEADHIFPKSKGGKDELINLITSCFDCNRGKSNREITNIIRPDAVKINLELEEKRQQLKEYHRHIKNIENRTNADIEYICNYFKSLTAGENLELKQKLSYKQFLKSFDKYKICEAMDIAVINGVYDICRYSYGILNNWKKGN